MDMKKIEELKWREFRLLDWFIDQKGNQKNMNALPYGETPLVSAKKIDNGFKGFYQVEDNEVFSGHCITLNNDGDGGAGLSYYQPSSFALDTHVTALYPIETMTKNVMLFIACCITKQSVLFGHGHSINNSRLNQLTIMLPVTDKDVPDFSFMEEYMKHMEQKLLTRYKLFLQTKILKTQKGEDKKTHKWKDFLISDIGEITSGRDIYDRERTDGRNPYVTATALQNGIGYFVGNTNKTLSEGCISVNRNGSVGYAFYHPYNALFGNDTRKVVPYNKNRWVNFFISRAITQQKDKYGYGLKLGTDRLKKQSIMLPATEDNKPDYEYMEHYMRNVELRLLNHYIDKRLKLLQIE